MKVCKSTLTKSYFNFEKIIISGENWPKIGHGITFLHMNKLKIVWRNLRMNFVHIMIFEVMLGRNRELIFYKLIGRKKK